MIKRTKLIFAALLFTGVGFCVYRGVKRLNQDRLDQNLITALRSYDSLGALTALNEGANPNACESPAKPSSLFSAMKTVFRIAPEVSAPSRGPCALLVAIDWRWREVENSVESHGHGYAPANAPKQDPAVIRALLEHGADANIRNEVGLTPLQIASWEGKSATVKLLLEHGAATGINMHSRERWSDPPLLLAIYGESVPTAQVLVEYSADINTIRGEEGCTALELARLRQDKAMVQLLEQALKKRQDRNRK